MPDVALNTTVEHETTVPTTSSGIETSVVVPLLDLDLGDNGVSSAGNGTSGLVRSRNRSFGSLGGGGGRGGGSLSTGGLIGRVGSSSSVLAQQTYGGSLSAVG